MKEYYQARFHWMFNYTKKNFWYCLAKTLCVIVGAPVYAVMFVAEMVLTAVYMIFSWIPVLNVVVGVICKALIFVAGSTFYVSILPDLQEYKKATAQVPEYEVCDVSEENVSDETYGLRTEDADEAAKD